jgi:hypothetical protein
MRRNWKLTASQAEALLLLTRNFLLSWPFVNSLMIKKNVAVK